MNPKNYINKCKWDIQTVEECMEEPGRRLEGGRKSCTLFIQIKRKNQLVRCKEIWMIKVHLFPSPRYLFVPPYTYQQCLSMGRGWRSQCKWCLNLNNKFEVMERVNSGLVNKKYSFILEEMSSLHGRTFSSFHLLAAIAVGVEDRDVSIGLCSAVLLQCAVQCCAVQCYAVQCSTVCCGVVQCCVVLRCVVV